MKGVILSAGTAQGLILGDDEVRYTFTPLGWRDKGTPPAVGMRVDFEVRGSHAVGIYPISGPVPTPPAAPKVPPAPPDTALPPTPGALPPTPGALPTHRALPPTPGALPMPGAASGQPAGPPPSGPPTAQGAAPAQPPPPPPATTGFVMRWWHWALAGGAALAILGIAGAFALGIFPTSTLPIGVTSTPPVGVELARHTHQGKTYALVEYGDELAIFLESGGPVSQRDLAEDILHSYALGQAVGDFDIAELAEVAGKAQRLDDSVSEARSLSDYMVGIIGELEYMETGDGASLRGVVGEAFADRARNTSGMGQAESLIRSLNSDLESLGDSAATLATVTGKTRGADSSSVSGDQMASLFGEAASAALELENSLSSAKSGVSGARGAADDMKRAFMKATVMRPVRDSDSLVDTLRDYAIRADDLESELSDLSSALGRFESGLGTLGEDARAALDSADAALRGYMARWLAEPYDTEWPPADPARRPAGDPPPPAQERQAPAPTPPSMPVSGSTPGGANAPFKLWWEVSESSVEAGKGFILTVRMYDVRRSGEHGGISVSFPSLSQSGGPKDWYSTPAADVEAVDYTSGISNVAFHHPGATIYHRRGNRQFAADYLLVESDDPSWSSSADRTLALLIVPKRSGEFRMQIRGWLCQDGYTDCARNPDSGAATDQQGWVVVQVSVSVTAPSAGSALGGNEPSVPALGAGLQTQSNRLDTRVNNIIAMRRRLA